MGGRGAEGVPAEGVPADHPYLDEKLATSSTWDTIKAGHKLVALLTLVRSFVHKHNEMKQGTMGYVEHTLQLQFSDKGHGPI
jgi:tryptophan synthase alpha subunit